jgi:hypothetical protein
LFNTTRDAFSDESTFSSDDWRLSESVWAFGNAFSVYSFIGTFAFLANFFGFRARVADSGLFNAIDTNV